MSPLSLGSGDYCQRGIDGFLQHWGALQIRLWGVETLIPGEAEFEVGYCTFADGKVEMPRHGTVYLMEILHEPF